MRDDAEVNRLWRVPDQDFGLLLGWPTIDRLILPESSKPGGPGPDRLIQLAVYLDSGLETGDLRGRGAFPLHDGAGEWILHEQQEREQRSAGLELRLAGCGRWNLGYGKFTGRGAPEFPY